MASDITTQAGKGHRLGEQGYRKAYAEGWEQIFGVDRKSPKRVGLKINVRSRKHQGNKRY